MLQRPLHSVKCTAWVAMSKHGIIGPFWFEDDDGQSQTDNKERSEQVLGVAGTPESGFESFTMVQQDGATPHTANETLAWLRQKF